MEKYAVRQSDEEENAFLEYKYVYLQKINNYFYLVPEYPPKKVFSYKTGKSSHIKRDGLLIKDWKVFSVKTKRFSSRRREGLLGEDQKNFS